MIQNSAALWWIFSLNKSVPFNRKKGFYTNRMPKKQEVEAFLYEAAQNFEVFINDCQRKDVSESWTN